MRALGRGRLGVVAARALGRGDFKKEMASVSCLTRGAMWEKGPVVVGMGATMTGRGGETGGQPRWVMERIISAF